MNCDCLETKLPLCLCGVWGWGGGGTGLSEARRGSLNVGSTVPWAGVSDYKEGESWCSRLQASSDCALRLQAMRQTFPF